ncbi:MAG: DUF4209 domain-containing protein [Mariniphaga sp.]|nr:DUF4209 domain-containing protein [Mariniphaga sp.]
MNSFEQYLMKLDESPYDFRDVHIINKEFQEISAQLMQEGKPDIASLCDLDRQVFSVQKSFDYKLAFEDGKINGLSCQISGTQTLEDGSLIPVHWPDVAKYNLQDFEYFEKRYNECKNLFAKTEYGLMVYFGAKTKYSKHQVFKKQLCNELFGLSKEYYSKAEKGGDKNFYRMDFYHTVRLAFGIAEQEQIDPELSVIIQYLFEIHQNWDTTKEGTLRILLDISALMSEYFGLFNKRIDFQKVLDKNLEGAKELEKTYIWGAIYAVDRNINIEQKRGIAVHEFLKYKAQLYEKLAIEAENNGNKACVSFAEDTLRIYQQLCDSDNIDRLQKYYSELRGKFHLTEFRQTLPKEYAEGISRRIKTTVEESNEAEIIYHFINTPWFDKIDVIRERSIESSKQTVLLSMLSTSILDKFGNTVDVFNTEEEKEKSNFWSAYSYNFQIGTQTMNRFFVEAYKAGKLNCNSVLAYLEKTWFNEVIERNYHGRKVDIKPIDTLKPGLKRIFEELDKSYADNEYQADFVMVIDSLALKVEGLLRYFCERIGIATFKTRLKGKGSEKLVMEKLLDDLLADIANQPLLRPDQITNFDEEDRVFIKYVMIEKAGLNLRNAVAHSLMDIFEYSFEHVVVIFCIIMKLSKYKIVEVKGEKHHDHSIK